MADGNNVVIKYSLDASGVEAGANRLTSSTARVNQALAQTSDRTAKVDRALRDAAANGISLTARQANALVSQMERLNASLGGAGSRVDQFNSKLKSLGLEQVFAPGVQGLKALEGAAGGAHSGLAGISRELMVMAHEGLTGNFKRMGGSAMVLGERLNILEGLLSPLGASLIAAAAAAAAFAYTMYEGYEQAEAFNKAIQSTSGYLGLSVGQMGEMSNGLVSTSASLSTVHEAMAQVAATGAFAGDQLQLATRAALAMASDIGVGTDKAAESLAKIQDNVIGWVTAYQREHHEFTAAQIEEIENFVKLGDTADATKVILSGIATSHAAIEADANAHMGAVLTWWAQFKDTVGQVKASILSIGMPDSIDKQVGDQYARVEAAQRNLKQQQSMGGMGNLASAQQALDIEMKKLQVLRDQQTVEHKTQQGREQSAKGGDAAVAVDSYLNADKYATPARKHSLDLQSEAADFAKATAGLQKGSEKYQEALKRHYENVEQINEQYAHKQKKPNEGGTNANITGERGDYTAIEADLKRHLATLKSYYDDGEMTQAAYLKQTHDAQVQALTQQIAIDKQVEALAATKRNPDALAQAHNRTSTDQASLDALSDPGGGNDKSMYAALAQQDKLSASLRQMQSQNDASNAMQFMPSQQKAQYAAQIQMREQYLQQVETLNEKYDSTPTLKEEDRQTELTQLQNEYNQKLQMYTLQQQQKQQVANSYQDQMKIAVAQLSGNGETAAQATGAAFTSAWQDSTNALNTFLTTGKGNFDQFVSGVLADMAKIVLQFAEMQAMQGLLGAIGGGSGGSSSSLFGLLGSAGTAVAGASSGGSNTYGFHLATGGHVAGPGSGTSDSIPAMLSNGEYVINAAATKKYRGVLDSINSGSLSHFATGGPVGSVSASSGSGGGGSNPVSVTVNHNGGGGLSDEDAKQLHTVVQSFVDQRMAFQMKRQGGYGYQIRHGMI